MDNDTKENKDIRDSEDIKADICRLLTEYLNEVSFENLENNYLSKDKLILDLMYSFHAVKLEVEELKLKTQKPKLVPKPRPWSDFNTSLMSTSTTGRTTNRSISRSKIESKKNDNEKFNKVLLTSPKVSINLEKSSTNKRLNASISSNKSNTKSPSTKKSVSKRDELPKSEVKKKLNFNFAKITNVEAHHRMSFKFEPKKKSNNYNTNDKTPFQIYKTEDNVIRSNIYSSTRSLVQAYESERVFNLLNDKSYYKIHSKIFEFLDVRNNLKNINPNLRINFIQYCLSHIREVKEKKTQSADKESSDLSEILELEILTHKEDVLNSYAKRLN